MHYGHCLLSDSVRCVVSVIMNLVTYRMYFCKINYVFCSVFDVLSVYENLTCLMSTWFNRRRYGPYRYGARDNTAPALQRRTLWCQLWERAARESRVSFFPSATNPHVAPPINSVNTPVWIKGSCALYTRLAMYMKCVVRTHPHCIPLHESCCRQLSDRD